MADCDVCGSPLSAGAGGGAGSWQSHVSDFNDPHRTMELVARELPALPPLAPCDPPVAVTFAVPST